jgi:hypothetical protein
MRYTSTINGTLTRAAFVARNQRCGSLITGSPGIEAATSLNMKIGMAGHQPILPVCASETHFSVTPS